MLTVTMNPPPAEKPQDVTTTTTTPNTNTIQELLEWNLIDSISPYLDRHMIFPLLDYFEKQILEINSSNGTDNIHHRQQVLQNVNEARYSLLRPTHMIDYMMDVHKSLNETETMPEVMTQQKQQVLEVLENLKKQCLPLLEEIDTTERETLQASGQWNIMYLSQQYPNITTDVVHAYRDYGRYQFDCGDYECARMIISNYILLFALPPITATSGTAAAVNLDDHEDEELAGISVQQQQQQRSNKDANTAAVIGNPAMYYLQTCDDAMLHVLWGRLACEILVLDWPAAITALDAVKTALESMASAQQLTALQALQQRTWLLHWSLFVYWNAPSGLEQLVELFLSEKYKQAITTVAPHLLRYLTAAVLLCKRRGEKAVPTAEARKLVKSLIFVMQDCDYTDQIVEFVNCLCIKFDFDSAQEKLAACEKVLSADFFLCHQTALFMEEARVFVFENYCRIHNKIDLVALGDKLAMDQERAERWIVDLIRNADLDAKIDSTAGCVDMGLSNPQTIHEQIVDRTRDLNARAASMTQNLSHLMMETRKEKLKREKLAREQD